MMKVDSRSKVKAHIYSRVDCTSNVPVLTKPWPSVLCIVEHNLFSQEDCNKGWDEEAALLGSLRG